MLVMCGPVRYNVAGCSSFVPAAYPRANEEAASSLFFHTNLSTEPAFAISIRTSHHAILSRSSRVGYA